MNAPGSTRKPLITQPAQGRAYDMGRMRAVFHADGAQTGERYSLSEWWLQPHTGGPGSHAHDDDHIYYVLAGTLSVCIDGEWSAAPRGSWILIPGGTPHGFENRDAAECGFLCINTPAGFERKMPELVAWFADNPPGDARPD